MNTAHPWRAIPQALRRLLRPPVQAPGNAEQARARAAASADETESASWRELRQTLADSLQDVSRDGFTTGWRQGVLAGAAWGAIGASIAWAGALGLLR
jgi:hypothetical protein